MPRRPPVKDPMPHVPADHGPSGRQAFGTRYTGIVRALGLYLLHRCFGSGIFRQTQARQRREKHREPCRGLGALGGTQELPVLVTAETLPAIYEASQRFAWERLRTCGAGMHL